MQALLIVVNQNGHTMLARTGVMRALNRHVKREFKTGEKKTHWGSGSWRGIENFAFYVTKSASRS